MCKSALGAVGLKDMANSVNSKVYLSFGGLLLVLHGPYRKLTSLKVEQMYLLVKR